jgi:hypothetical protein
MFRCIVIRPCAAYVAVGAAGLHDIKYNGHSMMKETKQNIRYLGFESVEDGRRFDFLITGTGQEATRVSLVIPSLMFTGANKISFQESSKICYEKLRVLLEREKIESPLKIRLTGDDIAQFRHIPRGRVRFPKTEN